MVFDVITPLKFHIGVFSTPTVMEWDEVE